MTDHKNKMGSHRRNVAAWMCGIAIGAMLAPQAFAQTAGSRAASTTSAAGGQQSPATEATIGDIIVTAQKRSESSQKTPLAITAISGANLRTAGIATVADLKQSVPTLELGEFFGVPSVTLRGVTLNALNFGTESPIAFHTDGVYFGRPAAALSGFYDVERVEVLRGAQGTLYGRNATGGSINIITADPTEGLSGYGQLTYGTYNHVAMEGAVGGALSDKVQVRLAGHSDRHDGYGINEATGHGIDNNDEQAVRAKIKFLPTDNLTILLSGDYFRAHSNPALHFQGTVSGGPLLGVLLGFKTATSLENVAQDVDPSSDLTFWGLGSTISFEAGDGVTVRSITSYRHSQSAGLGDVDLTTAALFSPALVADNASQFSQELQIIGEGKHAHWILGGYYFHEKDDGEELVASTSLFGPAPPPAYLAQGVYNGSEIKTDAYAVFGQYTRNFTGKVSITVGGRYSIEKKQEEISQSVFDAVTPFSFANITKVPATLSVQCGAGLTTIGYGGATGVPCVPSKTYNAFTPKIGIDYQLAPHTLLYASYSKGFKSGTFNPGTVQNPVQPEKLDDYEVGIKSTLLNGLLRANLAGFYYKYKDVQVSNTLPLVTLLENAAAEKIYGVEAEVIAKPTSALQIDVNGAWLHAAYEKYVTLDQLRPGGDGVTFVDSSGNVVPSSTLGATPAFNLRGKTPPQAPRLSGRIGAAYTISSGVGDFTLRGEVAYTSRIFITQYDTAPIGAVKAHTRYNVSLNYKAADGHLYASLNAKNLGNKRLILNGYAGSPYVGGAISGYLEPPRTVDLTVGYKF